MKKALNDAYVRVSPLETLTRLGSRLKCNTLLAMAFIGMALCMSINPAAAAIVIIDPSVSATGTDSISISNNPLGDPYQINVLEVDGGSGGLSEQVANLVDIDNNTTGWSAEITTGFSGFLAAGFFPLPNTPAAIFRGDALTNMGYDSGLGGTGSTTIRLSNLSASETYTITFYAARSGAGTSLETRMTATGQNSALADLEARDNNSDVGIVANITPSASGTIDLTFEQGPNNVGGFYFVNAIQVESTVIPEPGTLALLGTLGIIARTSRRRRSQNHQ